jgi:hypothetical protein
MQNKGMKILTVAAVLAVGYAIYDYQSEKNGEQKKSEQSKLIHFDKDQINSFDIKPTAAGVEEIHVDRTQEGWKLTAPIQEVADQSACEDYVGGSILEQSKDLVKTGAGIDWKIYGLDQPKAILSFTINSGQAEKIDVSAKKNFAGDSYLRIEGEDKVYTGATTWFNRANKRVFDFRDKRLLKKDAVNIKKFKMVHGKDSWMIEKKDGAWVAPAEPLWKLDQVRASETAFMLNTVNALEFSKEGAASASELKSFGLNRPSFTVEATLKEDKQWKAIFVDHDNKRYVQISEPAQILQISGPDMDKLGKMKLEDLRDKHEPFSFDKTLVKKMKIINGDLSAEFELKSDDWDLLNENKDLQYQKERPRAVLALIKNLEATDYFPPSAGAVRANIHNAISFYGADGKAVIEVTFLGSYKKKVDGVDKNYILTKSNLFPTNVGIDEGTLRAIGLETIVQHKNLKPADSKAEPAKPETKE